MVDVLSARRPSLSQLECRRRVWFCKTINEIAILSSSPTPELDSLMVYASYATFRFSSRSCSLFNISGSGSGSTLRGLTRGESSVFSEPHFVHLVPFSAPVGNIVLHSLHS